MKDLGGGADGWKSWVDDLPLPDAFNEGVGGLQEFISAQQAEITRLRASEEGALMILTQTIAERDAARAELAKLRAGRQPANDGEER